MKTLYVFDAKGLPIRYERDESGSITLKDVFWHLHPEHINKANRNCTLVFEGTINGSDWHGTFRPATDAEIVAVFGGAR